MSVFSFVYLYLCICICVFVLVHYKIRAKKAVKVKEVMMAMFLDFLYKFESLI